MSYRFALVEYDPRWPEAFARERQRLSSALAPYALSVEHIGSTAVPGLAAKPTIDVLVGLYRLSDAPHIVARMKRLGYLYIPEFEAQLPERRLFRQPPPLDTAPTHNVHAVEVGSAFYERHLLFRDWLRSHAEDRDAYAALKQELSVRFSDDRDAYTEAKTQFIRGIEEKARAAARSSGEAR